MHLYVVRHGTTDNNVKKLMNGRNNIDINEQGIEEAKMVELVLRNVKFDHIYCSPLIRAKNTMKIINSNNYPVTYDERLMERDAGVVTNKSEASVDFDLWYKMDAGVVYGGAETFKEVMKRVDDFLEDLKKHKEYDKVLLVTHAGVMMIIEVLMFGYPGYKEIQKWDYPNCVIKQYEI